MEHTVTGPSGLDPLDDEILDRIGLIHRLLDPPPSDLDERVRFAVALTNLDLEVSRLQQDTLIGSGARAAERVRTITFDSKSLTIMVTIAAAASGGVRLDGWLAPAGAFEVELRTSDPPPATDLTRVVTADRTGRFVFEDVPHGLAQLLVRAAADIGLGATVVTPSLML
jgi:hypothetical protein